MYSWGNIFDKLVDAAFFVGTAAISAFVGVWAVRLANYLLDTTFPRLRDRMKIFIKNA
jgi:hypothetical protein